MTRYRRTFLKSVALEYNTLFWGIVFVTVRAVLRIFKFTPAPPPSVDVKEYYFTDASYAVGYLSLLSIGAVGNSLITYTLRSSIGLRYATKYTKLTPSRARIENVIPGTLIYFLYTLVIVLEIISFVRIKAGFRISPKRYFPIILLYASFIAYSTSLVFGYLAALSRKFRGLITFSMLLLAFISYFTLRVSYGKASYLSPLQVVLYLVIYGFSGKEPLVGGFVMGKTSTVDIEFVSILSVIRLAILLFIGRLEMKLAKGVRPESIL